MVIHDQWKHKACFLHDQKIFTYIVADDYLNPSKDTYRTKGHIYDNFIHTWELTH